MGSTLEPEEADLQCIGSVGSIGDVKTTTEGAALWREAAQSLQV